MSTTIKTTTNGPYIAEGDFKLVKADGTEVTHEGTKAALCRCGQSSNKPFCDGSHKKSDFKAE